MRDRGNVLANVTGKNLKQLEVFKSPESISARLSYAISCFRISNKLNYDEFICYFLSGKQLTEA